MQVTRTSFLSFLFISCFSFSIIAQQELFYHDADHANNWAATCAEQMMPQELQFTANMLFLLYANAFIDGEIQRYYAPLLELSCAVRDNLANPYASSNELMHLRALTNKIACTTKIRLLHSQMLDSCLNYLDQNKNDIVDAALRNLQVYASDMLHEWAQQQQEITNILLEKSIRAMTESSQNIYAAGNLHRGLRNRELPFAVDERDKALAIFNILLKSTPQIHAAIDQAAYTVNTAADHAMQIISFGAETYLEHYRALYEIISNDAFDTNYAAIMFAPDGELAPEYRTFLPHPDYVFEYMLELTQLFEQMQQA